MTDDVFIRYENKSAYVSNKSKDTNYKLLKVFNLLSKTSHKEFSYLKANV
jgi:hypothetical protein